MDEVNESISKMACKNCGKVIVRNNAIRILWEHQASGYALCEPGNHNSTTVAEPEQAMSS